MISASPRFREHPKWTKIKVLNIWRKEKAMGLCNTATDQLPINIKLHSHFSGPSFPLLY